MTEDFMPMGAGSPGRGAADGGDGRPFVPPEEYEADIEREMTGPVSPAEQLRGGYMHPEAGRREAELKAALRALGTIEPVLDRNYLVKGWLDQGAASVVYGPSNVGKTFLALDLALHVAAGVNWHENRVRSDGGTGQLVIYIAAEGGTGVRNRLAAFRKEHPEVYERAEAGGFRLLLLSIDLCEGGDTDRLIKVLNDLGLRPALIVIDTLARAMGSGDENTAQDMGRFVASIDRVRAKTGAHVMAIHHSGKDAARGARGSSSLRGAVDTEIALSKERSVVTAKAVKQRDMPMDRAFHYSLLPVELGEDEDGDMVTSCVVRPDDAPLKVPKLSPQQEIALQALGDAVAKEGKVQAGDVYPDNRLCVSIECWRKWCKEHHLADDNRTAFNTAFSRAKKALHEQKIIRIVGDYVWRCAE